MHQRLSRIIEQINQVILGKGNVIELALCCLLARGHLLLEDLPGMGKTSLSQAIAQSLGLSYQRIQFTSDLLPADILGVTIFDPQQQNFQFHAGPIFKQLILADEINRASPKTQSALLEAMAERQVTIDGHSYPLPQPFFVIATQNPSEQSGTFPLPESQLDRFLMRLSLGYPAFEAELKMLQQQQPPTLQPLLDGETLLALQQQVEQVNASESLLSYLLRLVEATRQHPSSQGLSPRGSKALLQAAKAHALLSQRDYVIPEDIQKVFTAVAQHRLKPNHQDQQSAEYCQQLLENTRPLS